jgi:hypothetical protein
MLLSQTPLVHHERSSTEFMVRVFPFEEKKYAPQYKMIDLKVD